MKKTTIIDTNYYRRRRLETYLKKQPFLVDISVVLIFFNRPDCLQKVFDTIKEARPSKLFLVQDGPRTDRPDDIEKINKCRQIVQDIDWECEVHRDYSEKNLSAHPRIFSGITNAFKYCDSLMVLEDDVIPAVSYFRFCEELLEKYKNDARIHYINGLNRLNEFPKTTDSYFFSMEGTGFGLATWKRVWDQVLINSDYGFLNDKNTISKVEKIIKYVYPDYYKKHLKMAASTKQKDELANTITSWERPFGITQTLNGTLCITPVKTMFEYVGVSEEATFSGSDVKFLPKRYQRLLSPKKHEINFPLKHPKYVIRDVEYEKKHDRIYSPNIVSRAFLFCESIFRRVLFGDSKKLLKGLKNRVIPNKRRELQKTDIETQSAKNISIGALMSYIVMFVNIILGIIYTPWIIRQIGQADHGLYSLATTIISFFAMDFGLGCAIARFLSKARAENDKTREGKIIYTAFKIYFVIDAILLLTLSIAYFFIEYIYVGLTIGELEKLKVVFCISGLASIITFPLMPLNGILISYEKFPFAKLCDLIHKVGMVFLTIIALIMGNGLYGLVVANAVISIVTVTIKIIYVRRKISPSISWRQKDNVLVKEIFTFSAWTSVTLIAQRISISLIPTVLGIFAGSIQISIYNIGQIFSGYTATFASALNSLFLPKILRISAHETSSKQLQKLMVTVGKIQFGIVGIIVLGIVTMGQEFILLWVGKGYKNSYYVALLLTVPCLITLTQNIAETTLIALNKIKFRSYISIGMALVTITVSAILTPKWGAVGAAIAITAGELFNIVFINFVYCKVLKFDVLKFFRDCHMKMLVPWCITATVALLLQYFKPVDSIVYFVLKAGIVVAVYLNLIWLLALNKVEKNRIVGFAYNVTGKLFRRQ